jgi:hypothetical protein
MRSNIKQREYLPAVWDLKISPRIQIFVWLLSQNKILTRDNLRKRGISKPIECSLCKEVESISNLFFDCLISKLLWADVFEIFDIWITDFLSLATKWLHNKRYLQLVEHMEQHE